MFRTSPKLISNGETSLSVYYQIVNGMKTKFSSLRLSTAMYNSIKLILTEILHILSWGSQNLICIGKTDLWIPVWNRFRCGGFTIFFLEDVESIFVNLSGGHKDIIIVGAIYSPTQQPSSVYWSFCDAMQDASYSMLRCKFICLLGDFNEPDVYEN